MEIMMNQNKYLKYAGGLVLLTVAIVITYFIHHYYIDKSLSSSKKYMTNLDNNDNELKNASMYFFYATWCTFSMSALPEWNRIVEKYHGNEVNGYRINCIGIDCTNETIEIESEMKKYNIEGFPTLKLIKDDHIIEFDAKVTYNNMQEFIKSVL
jgi:thiol-disulfide isomerase/thioredoxin